MSKALSANIHDPNHTADDYDLYFNGEPVSAGSGYSADDIAEKNITGDIILNTATAIKIGSFAESAITSATGTAPERIETEAFRYCNNLININFPNITDASGASFAIANCANLEELYLPKLSGISGTTFLFSTCPKLKIADIGIIDSMTLNMFSGDTALRKLILRKTGSICSTNWANAGIFGGIYSNPTESTIYVPSALINSYQSAANWSTLSEMGVTFSAIEGSEYE